MIETRTVNGIANPGASAKRVLIIKLSALGDFVLALGAMRTVRQAHRSAQITLLTTSPYKNLSEKCPYVDIVETDGRPESVGATRALLKRIRQQKYDIIYDFHTSGRTANYFKALNLPGFKPPLWSGHAEKCAFPHNNPNRGAMHTIDRLAEQLTDAGIGPAEGFLPGNAPMPDLSWVRQALGNPPRLTPEYFRLHGPFALIIPGASKHREAKIWPSEYFAKVATHIADAGVKPVIIGGVSEGKIASEIRKAEPRVLNLVTRTDLFQIVGLAEHAAFAVGNDTGPMHMATLSGAPGVALFATSESNIEHASPRGPNPVIIVHGEVLKDVRPEDVWQAIKSLGRLKATHNA